LPVKFLQIKVFHWYTLPLVKYLVDNSFLVTVGEDDKRLIENCILNKREAQKRLYEKYFGKMMSIARRYVADYDRAVDVVNTSFVKIFNNLNQYKGSGPFQGWMSRIVTNTSLDFIRANKKYDENIVLKEEITADYDYLIDEELSESIDISELYQMIDKLPNMCRAVFNLYVIDGYSHNEIGEELGISDGTSKAHLSLARKKLKEMILNRKNDKKKNKY